MSFFRRLGRPPESGGPRRWVYVPYDQLSPDIGPLGAAEPGEVGVVLVESPWKAGRRRYHRQKLALVLANQRHFALELKARGVAVDYRVHDGPYHEALDALPAGRFPLTAAEPAERELREDLAPLVAAGRLRLTNHDGWLTTRADFVDSVGRRPPFKMDTFYRAVRRSTGILMDGDGPVGGKFSFDHENRKPWRGEPPAPTPPRFEPDEVTREVGDLVEERYRAHPGEVRLAELPATAADAAALWSWARRECLRHFGPYEDAMSTASEGLFHTRISPLMNLHRLRPRAVLEDVLAMDLPLASKEGFVRQVLGWREFVRHVHRVTDGFRDLPDEPRFKGLGADAPLPPAFWGTPSGMRCLDTVVAQVWREGWSHHITRLMILSNLATLLGYSAAELSDWFWVAYIDAFDWVVEPNVLGMGTYGVGPVLSTKPYVSGAAYINRMSDYCKACPLDPKSTCPVTRLYWAFLDRHREDLAGNHRIAMPLKNLARRGADERARDRAAFEAVRARLDAGARVDGTG